MPIDQYGVIPLDNNTILVGWAKPKRKYVDNFAIDKKT